LLDKRLSYFEEARSHASIHISDLTAEQGFCPREVALCDTLKVQRKGRFVNAALRVAFDNGLALHDLCRNKWLEDDIVGSWVCTYCSNRHHFTKKPKTKCTKCGGKHWQYHEEEFIDPETKVTGSIDFFVDLGNGKFTMVEVKSMSKDQFKELQAPLAEHRIRTTLYLELLRRSDRPEAKHVNTEYGFVLYISKGYGAKLESFGGRVTPFRDFVVRANTTDAQSYFDKGKVVRMFREKRLMPAGICPTMMSPRVKKCSVAQACWGGSYPVGGKV